MRKTLRALGLVVILVPYTLFEVACGGHSTSPTAPSAAPSPAVPSAPAPAPSGSGATISGTVASLSGPASTVVVGVEGTNVSAPADASGNFTLTNVPATDVVLTFSAPGVQATVPLGAVAANDRVQVSVTVVGSVATLDSQEHTAPNNVVDADGTLDNLDVAARQFTLNGTVVVVPTDAAIRRGDAPAVFGDLKRGDRVHVHGVKDGTTIRASEVVGPAVVTPPPPPTSPAPTPTPAPAPAPVPDTTLNGALSGLSGSCPAVSMTVSGTTVKTSASTVFAGRACAELRNGDSIYAIGPKQSDGSLIASKIYYVAPTPVPVPDVSVSGTVSGWSGACPAVSFTAGGTVVTTSSSTTFSGSKGCTLLANGDAVTATGQKQSDGSLLASKVEFTGPAPTPDTTLNGALSGLAGTCPALSMSVSGTAVKTSAVTVFSGKGCTELKNGDSIYAIGPKQSDGSVLASKIYYVAPTTAPVPDVSVSGAISGWSGACPAVSFTAGGTLVKTSSLTTWSGSKGCSVLANGDAVTATGQKQSDGSLLASKVEYTGPAPSTDVYVNGSITGLSGVCPALSMTLGGTVVKTNASTVFNGKACTELKNGDAIYAAGPKQSDGSILANRTFYVVPADVTVSGTISGWSGTCPNMSFSAGGTVVKTSSATTYSGRGCSVLQNGDQVNATGQKQSDGSLLASKVDYVAPVSTTVTGAIGSLGGTCPALTLSINNTVVKTTSATTFSGKACADLRGGDSVAAVGSSQSDGSIAAATITATTSSTGIYANGVVGSLSGSCPSLVMNVSGVVVKTGPATTFTNAACTDIKVGTSLYSSSTRQSDGSLLANFVQVAK